MPKFRVLYWLTMTAETIVEAENETEARDKADNNVPMDEFDISPLAEANWEYQDIEKVD